MCYGRNQCSIAERIGKSASTPSKSIRARKTYVLRSVDEDYFSDF